MADDTDSVTIEHLQEMAPGNGTWDIKWNLAEIFKRPDSFTERHQSCHICL